MEKKLSTEHLEAWRALITASSQLVGKIDRRMRHQQRVPLSWYDVLQELYETDTQRLRMSELADRVLLTRSGLTRLADKMEAAGYLRREQDPTDGRAYYAALTEDGIAALKVANPIHEQAISEMFASHLSDEDARTLSDLLARLI